MRHYLVPTSMSTARRNHSRHDLLKVADNSSESEDEQSSPEINNSESGAIDGSDAMSSVAEEEMEDEIAERLHAGCSCEYVDHVSALFSYSLSF